MWLTRAGRKLAKREFAERICPVCGVQKLFDTGDRAYSHVIFNPDCFETWYKTEEEKFNEEEKEVEKQQLKPEYDEGVEDPEEWMRYYSRNCKLLRRR